MKRQTATLSSTVRGRDGNGAYVLHRIDSCILNLKQPHICQELGKCPFGRSNEELDESKERHVYSYTMPKSMSVQKEFAEGAAGVV